MNFVKIIIPFLHFFNTTKIRIEKPCTNIFGLKNAFHDLDINEYKYIIL